MVRRSYKGTFECGFGTQISGLMDQVVLPERAAPARERPGSVPEPQCPRAPLFHALRSLPLRNERGLFPLAVLSSSKNTVNKVPYRLLKSLKY